MTRPSILQRLREETWVVRHVMRRDLPLRVATILLVVEVMAREGQLVAGLVLAAIGVFADGVASLASRGSAKETEAAPAGTTIGMLVLWGIASASLAMPGVFLAGSDSLPVALIGVVWSFGALVYTTNALYAAPTHLVCLGTLAYLGIWGTFLAMMGGEYDRGSSADWAILGAGILLYGINKHRTIAAHEDTHRALFTARREASERLRALEHHARHDPLTQLLNRRAFDEDLSRVLQAGARSGQRAGVLLIDLDGFKPINDSYSHEAGDAALLAVADRLSSAAGEEGLAARLGGDEFALAFPALGNPKTAQRLAQRLLRVLSTAVPYGETTLHIGASIGIALARGSERDTVEGLLNAADQAMYRAKGAGGNKSAVFDAETFPRRCTLQDRIALSDAIEAGEIRPYYQPKVRLPDSRLIGFEALARWVHPSRGILAPAEFLPQVSDLGLIAAFTARITRRVLADIDEMLAAGLDPGQVSLNLPEVSLTSVTGRQEIDRVLRAHPVAVRQLTLEITEDVFISRSSEVVADSIAAFRARGARISLDDFGTGFASFQNLRQLDYDELKIDRAFVAGLGTDPSAEVLVSGFLQMARGLGVAVVAEGIETEAQRRHLIDLGCRLGQGFLFGRALGRHEMEIRIALEGVCPAAEVSQPEPFAPLALPDAEASPPPDAQAESDAP